MNLYSYRKLIFSVLFSAVALVISAQTSKGADALPEEDKVFLDNRADTEAIKKTEPSVSGNTAVPAVTPDEQSTELDSAVRNRTSSSGVGLFQLFTALLVVCLLAYVVLKFLKKSSKFYGTDDPYLKNVASISIAQGKSIHVITLGDKAYIIGVTDSAVNKIGEVEDKNLIDAMNLENDRKNASPKKDFASVLASFIPSMRREKETLVDKDFFASQRERLNNAAQARTDREETP